MKRNARYRMLMVDGEIKKYWANAKQPRLRNKQSFWEFRTACIIICFNRLKNIARVADTLDMHINTVRNQLHKQAIGGTMTNTRKASNLPKDAMTMKELEKYFILSRLIEMKGNKTRTAHSLNIGLRTLQRRLNEYGVTHSLNARVARADIQPDAVMMAKEAIDSFKGAE